MNVDSILANNTILLIDRDPLIFRAMSLIFMKKNMVTLFAKNAVEALILLKEQKIDAVFMDIVLSTSENCELCQTIRGHFPHIPILVMSASYSTQIQLDAFDAGADDFIQKPPVTPILLQRLANCIARRRAEARNLNLMLQLESYISSATVEEIVHHSGIQKLEATILFSDMRGFTAATFAHDVEKVFAGINEAMCFQSQIIQHNSGYIDGFSGDGILAIFEGEDSCRQACQTASEIIRKARETKVAIWSPLPIGIGINYGEILRGNLGSEERKAYTVIGSSVNVSARLCGVARGLEAVCSEYVKEKVSNEFSFKNPQTVQLKGLPTPIEAYALSIV